MDRETGKLRFNLEKKAMLEKFSEIKKPINY